MGGTCQKKVYPGTVYSIIGAIFHKTNVLSHVWFGTGQVACSIPIRSLLIESSGTERSLENLCAHLNDTLEYNLTHGEAMNLKALVFILSLTALISGCGGASSSKAAITVSEPMELTLLHINDHHSHLDAENGTFQLATGADKREAINVERGGFPRITAAIKELEKDARNVIKIHSGDASTGDLYYTLNDGQADADMINTVCFDTFNLGNHEFDNADAGVKKLMGFLHAGTCKTPILSANVRFGPSSPMYGMVAPETVQPSVIIERSGQKIGVIGLIVAGKTKNSSRPNSDTTFIDEATAAQAEIDRLKAQGINKIILSTHIGYAADKALVQKLSGVDVVVGADSHTLLGPEALKSYGISSEGPYPTQSTDKDGKPVCIVQAWQYGYVVGEAKVSFDKDGDAVSYTHLTLPTNREV